MEIVAFLVAIPVGIELIAALYGPIDLACQPRQMLRALPRWMVVAAVTAGLGLWLGRIFFVGLASVAALFVIKHWLLALAYRIPSKYKLAIWN